MSETSFKMDPSAFFPAARNTTFLAYAAQLAERIRDQRRISRARRCALHEMPDHIVKDIGVTKSTTSALDEPATGARARDAAECHCFLRSRNR